MAGLLEPVVRCEVMQVLQVLSHLQVLLILYRLLLLLIGFISFLLLFDELLNFARIDVGARV